MVQRSSYVILSYKVKHNYDISAFLNSYSYLLQRTIDVIWENIEWGRKRKRMIPVIPKSREFKQELRNNLLQGWGYDSHYMDSAIKTAYSILNSWRRNYMKGNRGRNKPVVRRKFVRVKEALYRLGDWRIRVTLEPWEPYLDFDLFKVWFRRRVGGTLKGCEADDMLPMNSEGDEAMRTKAPIGYQNLCRPNPISNCGGFDG